MNNSIYEKNINSIRKRYPKWDLDIDGESNLGIVIEQEIGYFGDVITSISSDGNKVFLAGKYAPEIMAKREAGRIAEKKTFLQFIIGIGDGRIVNEFLKDADECKVCIICEPCKELFMHILQYYDISEIIQNEKCYFIVNGINDNDIDVLFGNSLSIEMFTRSDIYVHNNYEKLFYSEVLEIVKRLREGYDGSKINFDTDIYMNDIFAENIVYNFRSILEYKTIKQMRGKLDSEIPVILVAAGPSLGKNVQDLKKAKGKACIIACDTALKPLLKNGIVPDYFIVVDSKKKLELFEDDRIWDIPMIADVTVPHIIVQRHRAEKIFCDNGPYVESILKKLLSDKNLSIGLLETGGCVANCAFSFAYNLGARKIILVGQDLAHTGGKLHVDGAFKVDVDNNDEILIPSIDGGMVKSTEVLYHYLKWFEHRIKELEDLMVIDATEGGALIQGSKIMKLSDAIEKYCVKDFDLKKMNDDVQTHLSQEKQQKLKEFYIQMPHQLDELDLAIEKSILVYEELENAAKNNKAEKELAKLINKASTMIKELEKNVFWEIVSLESTKQEYIIRIHASQKITDDELSIEEDAKIGKKYLQDVKESMKKLFPIVNEVSEFYKNTK